MGTLTKMIEPRLRKVENIITITRAERHVVIARVVERDYSPLSAAMWGELLDGIVQDLDAANKQLAEAYEAFDRLAEGRTLDHRAADTLELVLWGAQSRIAEAAGPEILQLYGLDDSPPVGFRSLATYAHNTMTLLQTHPQSFEGHFGDVLTTEQVIGKLAPPIRALDDYLDALDDNSSEMLAALHARDRAADNWSRVWRGASTVLEGIFLLADRADLATHVQPILPGLLREQDHSAFDDFEPDDIEFSSAL